MNGGWQSGLNANMNANERKTERSKSCHKRRGILPGWMGGEGGLARGEIYLQQVPMDPALDKTDIQVRAFSLPKRG